ncbi:MAG: GFA family protein [Patescibacteria group bacterium]
MKTHKGSCHCGAVTYEVTADFAEGMKCNCSHCLRKGFLLAFVPEASFTLLSGTDNLTTYQFNKKHIDHTFCKTCGVQSFARGHDGKGNYMIAINLNCLEDFDTKGLAVKEFDGASV